MQLENRNAGEEYCYCI